MNPTEEIKKKPHREGDEHRRKVLIDRSRMIIKLFEDGEISAEKMRGEINCAVSRFYGQMDLFDSEGVTNGY